MSYSLLDIESVAIVDNKIRINFKDSTFIESNTITFPESLTIDDFNLVNNNLRIAKNDVVKDILLPKTVVLGGNNVSIDFESNDINNTKIYTVNADFNGITEQDVYTILNNSVTNNTENGITVSYDTQNNKFIFNVTESSSTGENNDGENIGDTPGGVGVYYGKQNQTLQFKNIVSYDARLTVKDDIEEISLEINLPNIMRFEVVSFTGLDTIFQFERTAVNNDIDEYTIRGYNINIIDEGTTGLSIIKSKLKNSNNLNFKLKKLLFNNAVVNEFDDYIEINTVIGENNTGNNLGTGLALFKNKTDEILNFHTLKDSQNIILSLINDEIKIETTTILVSNVGTSDGINTYIPILKNTIIDGKTSKNFVLRKIGVSGIAQISYSSTDDILIHVPDTNVDTIADGSETKIVAGTGISVTGDGTIATPYIITNDGGTGTSTGEINTGQSIGGAVAIYKDKQGTVLRFKSLVAGNNIVLTSFDETIVISLDDSVLSMFVTAGDNIIVTGNGTEDTPYIISTINNGEINIGNNVGTGVGLYKEKVNDALVFKTIKAGENITIDENINEVIINSVPKIYNGSNIGLTGVNVFKEVNNAVFNFRKIALTGIGTILVNNDVIEINIPAPIITGAETKIINGTNVTVVGTGTPADPYIIHSVNTQLSETQVRNIIGNMVFNNTENGIDVTYNEIDGKLNFNVTKTYNGNNVGLVGVDVFKDIVNNIFNFRKITLTGIGNITVNNDVIEINIPAPVDGKITNVVFSSDKKTINFTGTNGAFNSSINIYNAELAKQIIDASITGTTTKTLTLTFRDNTSITADFQDINTDTLFTAANLGTGVNLYKELLGTEFKFKTLKTKNNVNLIPTDDDITISADIKIENCIFVSKNGTNTRELNDTYLFNKPFLTIQEAIDKSKNSDTIYVYNGVYSEIIEILDTHSTNLNIYFEKGVVINGIVADTTEGFSILGEGTIISNTNGYSLYIKDINTTDVFINLYKISTNTDLTGTILIENITNLTLNLEIYKTLENNNEILININSINSIVNFNIKNFTTIFKNVIYISNVKEFKHIGDIVNIFNSAINNNIFNINDVEKFIYIGNITSFTLGIANSTTSNCYFKGTFISETVNSFFTFTTNDDYKKSIISGEIKNVNSSYIIINDETAFFFTRLKFIDLNVITPNTTLSFILYNHALPNWTAQNYQVYALFKNVNIPLLIENYTGNSNGSFNNIFFSQNSVLQIPVFYNGSTPNLLILDNNLNNPINDYDFTI